MNNHSHRAAMTPLSFRGHAGEPTHEIGGTIALFFCVIAGILAFAVFAAVIGLWAINKPVHPFACDQHKSECAAASEPF